METLQEWAEYYNRMKIWIFPNALQEVTWKSWKGRGGSDYYEIYKTWDWNSSEGIKLIVGKKGIRIVELLDRELLKEALSLLGLPEDYLWIIDGSQGLSIVIDTPSVSHSVFGMTNREYEKLSVIWEGYYILPSTGMERYFYKNRMPTEHPTQVSDDVFINCIEILRR